MLITCNTCYVAGVIFALKVVTTQMMPPGTQYVMGFFPVNSRLACWVELLAIQVRMYVMEFFPVNSRIGFCDELFAIQI